MCNFLFCSQNGRPMLKHRSDTFCPAIYSVLQHRRPFMDDRKSLSIAFLAIFIFEYFSQNGRRRLPSYWLQQRFHNVGGKLQHIPGKFLECCHNVATKRCKNHNIMATFIHNVTIRYAQCCSNLSEIWENPRISYQDMI